MKFDPGKLVITVGAASELDPADTLLALYAHLSGDWGILDAEDKELNEKALEFGDQLFSAYKDRKGFKFYSITEADRSVTTVLLPDEY